MSLRENFEVYFDFDNTITDFDVLDDIIQRFSINDQWRRAEEEWAAGTIGARACLERQLANVRVTDEALQEYLGPIKIDPAFRPIIDLLGARQIKPVIVSDSFSSIIVRILENNGVLGLKILSNEMRLNGNEPQVSFPYLNPICSKCANCKTSHLTPRDRQGGARKIYVGDGRSDICPAGFCEILFAKGTLLRHCAAIRKTCIPFENLGTVHARLQVLLN